jgi:energy-coupling factor transporter ATP-binding protein EcfA2
MDRPAPALQFESVSVTFEGRERPSIRSVTFRIDAGERVALLGNNGSGKTTLLFAAVGLLQYAGTITVGGAELSPATRDDIRARIGFLFSNPEDQILFPRVFDDVAFSLGRRGVPDSERAALVDAMLRRLDVQELAERSPHQLSQGERLRVALAGALIGRPPLLLLDEPSENLDPPGKRALASILAASEAAVLLATHDLRFAARCCTRFVVLEDGQIRADTAEPRDLQHAWDY